MKLSRAELCGWLRENSAGINLPAALAASIIENLTEERDYLRNFAEFVECWVVHHAECGRFTDAELVSMIRNDPIITEITNRYPGEFHSFDPPPYVTAAEFNEMKAERDRLVGEVAELQKVISDLTGDD